MQDGSNSGTSLFADGRKTTRRFSRRDAHAPSGAWGLLFALCCLLAPAGCDRNAHRVAPATEARALRAEQRDVDTAIARIALARDSVESYHIDGDILTVLIDGAAWKRLGTDSEDDLKRDLWRPWRDSYARHHPGTGDRVFLKIEDLQGNDLGSYFEH